MKKAQKIIALLLAVLIVIPTLLTTFSACAPITPPGGGGGSSEGEGGNGGEGEGGGGGGSAVSKAEYKLTLKSKGGMPLSDVNVYIYKDNGGVWEYEDFFTTDSEGKAKINLDSTKKYAYQPDIAGYVTEEYYPVVSANQTITLKSEVITGESIVGKKLKLGSIMYDFEVTTTEGESFKVSEMLKTHDAVVLNFWFDGCTWCEVEFPYMNTVIGEDKYKDSIALVALSWQDTLSDIGNYKLNYGLDNITMAHENPHANSGAGEISGAFSVLGYPTTVVIDRYGVVCLIEDGALTSERAFRIMFDHFIGEDYEQMLVPNLDAITPREEPDVEMPPSDEISDVFDDGSLGDITYKNDEEDVYSWPFDIDEKDGAACLRPSNDKVAASYAQLLFDVELQAGDAIAFDYFSSTELYSDILYVIVDGKDIFAISGESTDWKTCYAYVAETAGTYSVALVYAKDDDVDAGDDTVYIKNLRKALASDVDSETYIFRYAVKNPNKWGEYQDVVEPVFNADDGYYHVGEANGPLLLANLMGYSRYSGEITFYEIVLGKSYQNEAVTYCVFASNSQLTGVCPVTEELMDLLKNAARDDGGGAERWIEFCHYYDAYGTDKQLLDPIKGLASFSADDAILSDADATDFPNVLTYDRLITPRGLFKKFTPTESGVYRIISNSQAPVVGWVFKGDDLDKVIGDEARPIWYEYELCSREVINDPDNAYMMLYLEAGVEYYIGVAFYVTDAMGTVQFRLQRVGGEGNGYQLTLMSPGAFTYKETTDGSVGKILAGGREITYDAASGYWMEKRTDERPASYIYADFELCTGIMDNKFSLIDIIEMGGFDFTVNEDGGAGYVPDAKDLEIIAIIRDHDGSCSAADEYLRTLWGEQYDVKAKEYKLSEIYKGIYHGEGADYTAEMRGYVAKIIKAGDTLPDGTVILEGDARIGTVLLDARLAELLQLLMDKYTFPGVENSWRKLCYYDHTFCEETPF